MGMFLMIEASQFNFIGRCRKLGSRGRMRAKKGETKSTHHLVISRRRCDYTKEMRQITEEDATEGRWWSLMMELF
jgi:hypothetical protein